MSLGSIVIKSAVRSAVRASVRSATRGAIKKGVRSAGTPAGRRGAAAAGGRRESVQVSVRGADKFETVARRLKAAEGDLRKDMLKELRTAVKPLIAETRKEARAKLPARGGFAEQVAREPQKVQTRTGAKTAGVRVAVGNKRGGARAADKGTIRHPVFGSGRYVSQSVPPGWFTGTMQDKAPDVRKDLEKVRDKTLDRIARKPL